MSMITFRRIGDYWEAFDEDAELLSLVCGDVLCFVSWRDEPKRRAMCGFLYYQLDAKQQELEAAGITVNFER